METRSADGARMSTAMVMAAVDREDIFMRFRPKAAPRVRERASTENKAMD